jgi:glycosyltransferase involved in cell wall biosynthesis
VEKINMKKFKIVHVYKSFNVYNGLIEILSILSENIDKDRFELVACVNEYNGNEAGENFIRSGGKIEIIKNNSYLKEIDKINNMYKYFVKSSPHIVQTHVLRANVTAPLIAKAAHVPIVIATEMTLKNIAPPGIRRLRDKVFHIILNLVLKKCDRFVVTSEYLKKEWSPEWLHEKTEIIYPPFSIKKLEVARKNKIKTIDKNNIVVGFVGRLSEEKRVVDLIKAVKIIGEKNVSVQCMIVGTGPEEIKLKKIVKELKISEKVTFTGYSKNSFEKLLGFDIFVLPSRTEGCPIVILEAMAAGLPVVATNVGGNIELIQDRVNGVLVPPYNSEIMAEKLIELIVNKNLRETYGHKNIELSFSKFNPVNFTKRIENTYLNLLKEKGISL